MTKIYLSYGMEFADRQESYNRSIKLRNELYKLGYDVFNPHTDEVDLKTELGVEEDLSQLRKNNAPHFYQAMRKIIDYDIAQLHHTDAVIAYLDKSARGGVPGELTVAHLLGIPVYSIVNPSEISDVSGWTLCCSDQTFYSVDECLQYIKNNPII